MSAFPIFKSKAAVAGPLDTGPAWLLCFPLLLFFLMVLTRISE